MNEQMTLDDYDPHTHARSSDPVTSKRAAHSAKLRAGTHKHRLLVAYSRAAVGFTDEEAAVRADLLSVGYWKRCSDLRNAGLIEPVKHANGGIVTRLTDNGDHVMVCSITDLGLATLTAMKDPNETEPEYVPSVCLSCGGANAEHHSDCSSLAEMGDREVGDIIVTRISDLPPRPALSDIYDGGDVLEGDYDDSPEWTI